MILQNLLEDRKEDEVRLIINIANGIASVVITPE